MGRFFSPLPEGPMKSVDLNEVLSSLTDEISVHVVTQYFEISKITNERLPQRCLVIGKNYVYASTVTLYGGDGLKVTDTSIFALAKDPFEEDRDQPEYSIEYILNTHIDPGHGIFKNNLVIVDDEGTWERLQSKDYTSDELDEKNRRRGMCKFYGKNIKFEIYDSCYLMNNTTQINDDLSQ